MIIYLCVKYEFNTLFSKDYKLKLFFNVEKEPQLQK